MGIEMDFLRSASRATDKGRTIASSNTLDPNVILELQDSSARHILPTRSAVAMLVPAPDVDFAISSDGDRVFCAARED